MDIPVLGRYYFLPRNLRRQFVAYYEAIHLEW